MDLKVDFSEVNFLEAVLGRMPAVGGRFVRAAVEHSAIEVRNAWREKTRGSEVAPHYNRSITYDIGGMASEDFSYVRAEIGPDKELPQGALGNLIEYGSVNNTGRGYGAAALEDTRADFERGLAKALYDAEIVAFLGGR